MSVFTAQDAPSAALMGSPWPETAPFLQENRHDQPDVCPPRSAHRSPRPRAALFAVAATQFVLMFGAAGVLSSGLGWPQSLDLPAAQALPLIHEQASTVALGYSLYFLSAFLLIPLAVMVGGP